MSQTVASAASDLAGWPPGLLEAVLRNLGEGIVVRRVSDGHVVYANAEAARLMGAPDAGALVAAGPLDVSDRYRIAHADGTPLDPDELPGRRALRGEQAEPLLVRFRSETEGPDRVAHVSAVVVPDESGSPQHVISFFRDVTGEHRLGVRQAFAAGAGVALAGSLDVRGSLTTVVELAVPAFAEWCAVELVGDGQAALVAEAGERPAAAGPLRPADVTATGEPQVETHALCLPIGAFGAISFAVSGHAHAYGAFDLVLARDLATRAAAAVENALLVEEAQRTSALLDTLFGSAPVGLGFWDREFRYVRVNDALAELNGVPRDEHLGRLIGEVLPDLAPALEEIWRGILETGEPALQRHVAGIVPAHPGSVRSYRASYYPVTAATGEILGIGAIVEDVTERLAADRRAGLQHAVTRILADAESVDAAIPSVLQAVGKSLGWDVVCFWPAEPERPRTSWVRDGVQVDGFVAMTLRLDLSAATLPGTVVATREPAWVESFAESSLPRASLAAAEGLTSGVVFPIVTDAGVSGVIEAFTRESRPEDPGLLETLRVVGSQLGQFLQRKHAEDERVQLLRREQAAREDAEAAAATLRRLERITDAVLTNLSLDGLLNALLERIVEVLEADAAAIHLVTPNGDLETRAAVGLDESLFVRLPFGKGLAGTVAATRAPAVVPDLAAIDVVGTAMPAAGLNSVVAIPLIVEDAVIGVMYAASKALAQFTDDDVRLLELMADRIAFAVNQAALREAEQEAQERLQFLGDASAVLGSSLDVDSTLGRVARLAVPRIADWCALDLRRGDGSIERVAMAHADEAMAPIAERLQQTSFVDQGEQRGVGAVIRTGRPVLYPVVREDELRAAYAHRPEYLEPLLELGFHTTMVVPLRARGRVLGALSLARTANGAAFTPDDLRFAEELAARAASAVDNAQLFREAEESRDRLRFLADASVLLGSSLNVDHTLEQLGSLLAGEVADWCAIHLTDEAGAIRLVTVSHRDPSKLAWARADPAVEDAARPAPSHVRRAIERGEPLLFTDAEPTPPGTLERAEQIHTGVVVPLIARSRVLGTLSLVRGETPTKYTDADLGFAVDLARRAAIAIDNAQLFRAAEERAQAARVLASVGDGVFLVDRLGIVRTWNRAAATATGLVASAVVDRPAAEAIPGWAEVAPSIPVAQPGAPVTRAESVPLDVGGRELWLSIHGVSVPDGVVYAFRDLTDERALERMRTEFVSTVSHELRTPLAAIYGAAMTLRRSDVALDDDQRQRLLDVVSGEADRLARIVNDILWASRLDTDTLHVNIHGSDPVSLARDVVDAQRVHLDDRHELVLEAEEGLPEVSSDPDKVGRILINLVDNAVKYSPDGGKVTLSVRHTGSRVRFSVGDEGLGIPLSEQRRVFEKFYRLDPQMTRGVGGTGLGLYICRELVHRMDGRIWVESGGLGRGSTFHVELPVS